MPEVDFHHSDCVRSQAHGSRFRGNDVSGEAPLFESLCLNLLGFNLTPRRGRFLGPEEPDEVADLLFLQAF